MRARIGNRPFRFSFHSEYSITPRFTRASTVVVPYVGATVSPAAFSTHQKPPGYRTIIPQCDRILAAHSRIVGENDAEQGAGGNSAPASGFVNVSDDSIVMVSFPRFLPGHCASARRSAVLAR
jgi:hypothetical protein